MDYLLVALAATFLLEFALVSLSRVAYPYDLGWVEEGYLLQIRHIMDRQAVYVAPSLNYVPAIYTPLYFELSAILSKLFGYGMYVPRLLSLASSVGTFALVALFVHRRSGSLVGAIAAAGLFAACFRITAFTFDGIHPDALALFLVLAAWTLSDSRRRVSWAVASPLIGCLAVATKQTMFPAGVMLVLAAILWRTGPMRFVPAVVFGLGLSIFAIWNQITSNGWFAFYTITVPSNHRIVFGSIVQVLLHDLVTFLPAIAISIYSMRRLWLDGSLRSDVAIGSSLIVLSIATRIHELSWTNVLSPLCASVSLFAGLAVAGLNRSRIVAAVRIVLCGQFVLLAYSPFMAMPTIGSRQAVEEAIALVRSSPQPVFWPDHPWYVALAGGQPSAHEMAMRDVMRAGPSAAANALRREMNAAINQHRFGTIFQDTPELLPAAEDFGRHYRFVDQRPLPPLYPDPDWPHAPILEFRPMP